MACLGITLHQIPSLILLIAMAIQSNFHFKAMLDLYSRQAMQPRETTMRGALLHNSQTWLSNVLQSLFFQLPLFSLFTLQFFQELQEVPGMLQSCSESTRSNSPSSSKSLHADSSDSNGDTDFSPKEGKKQKKEGQGR